MDALRFDELVASLFAKLTRRQMAQRGFGVAIAAGVAALAGSTEIAAKKKKKKKKKKTSSNRCVTFGNQLITCSPGLLCCDPSSSTVAACREPGYPVCCVSSGFSHPAGSRCCPSFFDGLDGFCPPDAPVCCSSDVLGGCCPAAFPVCCPFDCCVSDDFCHEDGFCFFDPSFRARDVGAEGGEDRKSVV